MTNEHDRLRVSAGDGFRGAFRGDSRAGELKK